MRIAFDLGVVLVHGMLEAVKTLHENGHYLIVAAVGDASCEDSIYREVGKNFGRYIREVQFNSNVDGNHSKYDLLRWRGADVIVDDRLETVLECARAIIPIRGILFNHNNRYGWNACKDGELRGIEHLVRRATSGEEVVRAVEEFAMAA